MKEVSYETYKKLIIIASILTAFVSISDFYVSKFDIDPMLYFVTRIIFIGIPIVLVFIDKISVPNRLIMTFINYACYAAYYQIILDNSYYFTLNQILLALLFFFYYDRANFLKAFWPVQIIVNGALFFSKEMSIVKEGETFVPDLFLVGISFSVLIYYIQKRVAGAQLLELEKVERLATLGMQSSFFMHEIKGHASKNDGLKQIIDTFYHEDAAQTKVCLCDIIDQQIVGVKNVLKDQGIIIDNQVDREYVLNFNLNHLVIIVTNLFRNAVESMYEDKVKGEIVFATSNAGFTITNSINHSVDLKKIFNIYYTAKEKRQNKGLGLALVKDFCKKNGFDIKASQDSSTIRFEIFNPSMK